MKRETPRRRALAKAACVAASLSCAACLPQREPEELPVIHDGQSDPVRAWIRAVESGDVDAIADMHMPNSRAYPVDKAQVQGMLDITNGYAELFSKYSVRLVVRDAHYLTTPQLTYSWGQAEWTFTPRKGDRTPTVVEGRFSDLTALDHGRWRYVMEHASTPVPVAVLVPVMAP
jgi:ketosteroid isomerase-like protein